MFRKMRAAAETGARDEVRRQLKPAVDRLVLLIGKLESNGLETGVKGPGGVPLGSVWLKIPDSLAAGAPIELAH